MNCAGTPELRTPNLDRLAATGIRFENFFCASPVCSPARASILTGQMPSQHGVQDFLRAGNSVNLPGDGKTIQYLDGRTTYVEILGRNGYDTGLSG
ncbi:MAG: sulfatase-like hydrolase/transferase, partial [Chloroflexi bacterium]|nr:sulfatase-like hydrolase/transferase [Chloroflexota bacterium]